VAYGANGQFNYKYGVTGGVDCNNATFGDPISGVGKACYIKAVAPAPAPTPVPPPTPARPAPTAITEPNVQVRSTGINLRSGPGTNYSVIGSAGAGAQLRITGKNSASDWWQVCCVGGQEAWVAAWVVDAFGPLSQVPVMAQPSSASTAVAQGRCEDSYEPNDNRPTQLTPSQIQATICPKGDVDMYIFNVSAGDSVYLSLTNLPADYDISLVRDSGNKSDWVGHSENSYTIDEEIRWTADKNGTLTIVVTGYNGATSTKPYDLTLKLFPKVDLDSRTADPSAELTPETRRKLQDNLTFEGFDKLMQVAKYMYNSQKCLAGIAILLDTFGAVLPPGTSEACAGAINQINDILQKYYDPPPVE